MQRHTEGGNTLLITNDIPDLIGGVSQQAPLLRFANQASEQINCRNSVVTGMSKRPHTNLVAVIEDELCGLDAMRTHIIQRDNAEQYLVGVGDGSLKVWDLKKGFRYTVEDCSSGYLLAGTKRAESAFNLLTLGDDTYILNKTMPVGMDYSKRSGVAQDELGDKFKVWRLTVVKGGDDFPRATTERHWQTYIESGRAKGRLTVGEHTVSYDIDYKLDTAEDIATKLKELGIATTVFTDSLIIKVPSETHVSLSDESYVTMVTAQNGRPRRRWTQAVKMVNVAAYGDAAGKAITEHKDVSYVWIRQADYAVNYKVIINDVVCEIKTPDSTANQAREGLNSEKLTKDLAADINGKTEQHGCVAEVKNAVIIIYSKDGSEYKLDVQDGLYNTALKLCRRAVQTEDGLPPYAFTDDVIHVTGEASDTTTSGYYVHYDSVSKVWKETTKRGCVNHFNANTMPHLLRRLQDKSYETPQNRHGVYFKLTPVDWAARTVGDEDTVAAPSFVSEQDDEGNITAARYISCMAFFRGRLWLLGGDYAVSSVAQDRHNFWQSTALSITDDDPIDTFTDLKSAAETIHSAIPSAQGLLVFSGRAQYCLNAQGALTPTTFEFRQVSSYTSDQYVEPQSVGDRVIFTTQRSDYCAVYDSYATQTGDRVASDISSHVPEYLYGTAHHILAGSTSDTQFYIMKDHNGDAQSTIYVYNYMFRGNERVQSAWSKWQFNGQVLDGVLTQDALTLIFRHTFSKDGEVQAPQYTIERIDLVTDPICNKLGHPVYLDHMQQSETEPTDLFDDEEKQYYKGTWYRGFRYNQLYTFSPFFIRDGSKGIGLSGGRLQLRRLILNFDKTTCFKVVVDTLGREQREVFFQGRVLGDIRNRIGVIPVVSGKRGFPLLGSSESITVSIENDGLFDARFQSGFWEGFYHNRARRY